MKDMANNYLIYKNPTGQLCVTEDPHKLPDDTPIILAHGWDQVEKVTTVARKEGFEQARVRTCPQCGFMITGPRCDCFACRMDRWEEGDRQGPEPCPCCHGFMGDHSRENCPGESFPEAHQ